ncbi:MAG: hypothetical protein DMG22_19435 [Acidobacteria bacterium]|nr:MAG: hypothetical protein DMG22_19435 [Acidobacteriota bacterium]
MSPRLDDPVSIPDDEDLWRRVYPAQACFKQLDGGHWRPSSAMFLDRTTGEVSVHRASLTTAGLVLARYPRHSLAAIKAAIPRRLGYAVCPDPIMNDPVRDDDPAHALICPPGIGSGKIKANAREMAQAAAWVVLRNPPY